MLLTGHTGKLVKVAGGIMNTHSREADCRMEIISAAAVREGAERDELIRVLDSLTTDEALAVLKQSGRLDAVCARLMDRIIYNLNKRAGGSLRIESIMYSKEEGQLAASGGALSMLEEFADG